MSAPRRKVSRVPQARTFAALADPTRLRIIARLVRSHRSGRETLYELNPEPLTRVRGFGDEISAEWDEALSRLKTLVER